jgi:hypothetical protein
MLHCWPRFLIEGDNLYDYMIHNFDTMFEDDTIIKHFQLRDGIYRGLENLEELTSNYGEDIQKNLIPWIKKEKEENRLFDKTLWKPFRDQYNFSEMYYGYKKLFQYKHYYFQLVMESECIDENCKYCIASGAVNSISIILNPHFGLALYGWKAKDSDMLQQNTDIKIPDDNMMAERHWIMQ